MAGIFDIKKGAFDSSEAALLHQAFEIALQGLRATNKVDRALGHRLARSIVKVARSEPDCLRNDGTIEPAKLAQRAILRMLQMSAPSLGLDVEAQSAKPQETPPEAQGSKPGLRQAVVGAVPESPAKIMLRLFERTPFAKL